MYGNVWQGARINPDCAALRKLGVGDKPTPIEGTVLMPYLPTYRAFVKHHNSTEIQEWTGLRKTQAMWRYHWLARNYRENFKEWGWGREWEA